MKKTWIKVKRGLLASKHRTKLGIRIWLYLHILDRTDWETGKILDWRDKDAGDELEMPERTVREQRRQLEADGYISTTQKRRGLEITVHNWTNPREYTGTVYNPRPELELIEQGENVGGGNLSPLEADDQEDDFLDDQGDKDLPPTTKGDIKGDMKGGSKPVTLTLYPQNHIPHTIGERQDFLRIVLDHFVEETKLKEPAPDRMDYFKKKDWWEPIVEICEGCEWKPALVLEVLNATLKHMDDSGLAMTCPRSIRNVASSTLAKKMRGASIGGNRRKEEEPQEHVYNEVFY